MRRLCGLAALAASLAGAAAAPGWEDARDPKDGRILGVGEVRFRRVDSVTAKSPRLTIVGLGRVSTYCPTRSCPDDKRYYERVTLVIDTSKRGFRGGPLNRSPAEWGRHVMTKSLAACGKQAAEAKDFAGDYSTVDIINAHDYETTLFQRSATEARIEYKRTLDMNKGDGLDCSVSFIDKGKGDENDMAWPPVERKLPPFKFPPR